jgi:hypothetical protein
VIIVVKMISKDKDDSDDSEAANLINQLANSSYENRQTDRQTDRQFHLFLSFSLATKLLAAKPT